MLDHGSDDDVRDARSDQFLCFTTRDNLTVALNRKHIVTMMYGDEDTAYLMEQVAVVPTQSTTGEWVSLSDELDSIAKQFAAFRDAVQKWNGDLEALDELPFAQDRRAPRAYLVDLKQPFVDHSGEHEVTGEQWHLWDELSGDDPQLTDLVAFTDEDEMTAHVLLRHDQVTVLECPSHLISRSIHQQLIESGDGEHSDSFGPAKYRKELASEGVFSKQEVDRMVDELRATYPPLRAVSPQQISEKPRSGKPSKREPRPGKTASKREPQAQPMSKSYAYLEKLKAKRAKGKQDPKGDPHKPKGDPS